MVMTTDTLLLLAALGWSAALILFLLVLYFAGQSRAWSAAAHHWIRLYEAEIRDPNYQRLVKILEGK
jgi:hypothetical protein